MKRLLAFLVIWTLLVLTGTIVSANSQTRRRHVQLPPLATSSSPVLTDHS